MAPPPGTNAYITPYGASGTSYALLHVNIETWSSEVVFAEDNMTPIGSKMHVAGTAMMSVADWDVVRAKLKLNASRLASAYFPNPGGSDDLISFVSGDSNIGGPFCKLTGTQVVGSTVVLVRFEIDDQQSGTGCENPIVATTWVQSMSIDATGRPTRTVRGTIRIARSSSASILTPAVPSTWSSTRPYADLFRFLAIPDLPAKGWRRESQEFAYDQMSTALVYQIVDKQYAHDLPDGVMVGDMDFSFERRAEDAGIGHCSFSCELEGSLALDGITGTTGNRRLVEAAVQLSKTRINANYSSCIITRMRVTERSILSGYSIRFEVDADVFPDNGSGAMVPLATMIGQAFTVTRSTTKEAPAYGAAASVSGVPKQYWMVPHYVDNIINGMNCDGNELKAERASLVAFTGANSYGTVVVAVTAGATGVPAMNSLFTGKYSATQAQYANDNDGYANIIAHNVAITSARYDSGICRLSPMYVDTGDFLFQTRKPSVLVSEKAESSRANVAPAKYMRPLPTGAFLVHDNFNCSFGKYDPQGQRLFSGVYERTYALYDLGGNSGNGFTTQTAPSGANLRAWVPPNNVVLPTLSATGTALSQSTASSVFAAATTADARYPVYGETFVT
jgi:hypothetical protein